MLRFDCATMQMGEVNDNDFVNIPLLSNIYMSLDCCIEF
jgi:hypothetical protein